MVMQENDLLSVSVCLNLVILKDFFFDENIQLFIL